MAGTPTAKPYFQKQWLIGSRHYVTDRCVRTPDTCRHSTEGVIMKISFRDKHERRSIQLIKMEKTHSKQQTVLALVYW